jgi:hypothetical protein
MFIGQMIGHFAVAVKKNCYNVSQITFCNKLPKAIKQKEKSQYSMFAITD